MECYPLRSCRCGSTAPRRPGPTRPATVAWQQSVSPSQPVGSAGRGSASLGCMDPRTGLPIVGMVGAGQLARMTHQAAVGLGQSLRIMAGSPDDGAALVAPDVVTGDHTSYSDLAAFAAGCDVLTFDHEHVPNDLLRRLAEAGHVVYPPAPALRYAQDKRAMRERLTELGVPVPRWVPLPPAAEGCTASAGSAIPEGHSASEGSATS